eukprot:909357_1
MLLILFSILTYKVFATSNYIIDTPPGQLDDAVNGVVNWAYPIDICMPNHFVSRGITAYVKYECKQVENTNTYSVTRHSYDILDTNCNGNVIKTKIFYTSITKGLPGYFVCDKEQSEYAIINVYDNDESCATKSPISLYSVIASSDDPLCFHDRNVYISLFECGESGDDINNLENSYIKEAVYEDNECINPIVSSTLTSSDCQIIGTMNLVENKGGRSIIFGSHDSCHDQYHNHKINMDESDGNALLDGNDTKYVDMEVSSGVVYVGLIAFLFINGCLWWCYLYVKKG